MMTRKLMMATGGVKEIDFVSATVSSLSGNSTDLVLDKPADVAAGDTLVAFGSGMNDNTWTVPSGWSENYDQGASPGLLVATRELDGSEGSSFTFTHSSSRPLVGFMVALRANGAFDLIGSPGSVDNDIVAPSITATGAGMLLMVAAAWQSNGMERLNVPAGMTAAAAMKLNGQCAMRVFYEKIEAGATGSRTVVDTDADQAMGWLLNIKAT